MYALIVHHCAYENDTQHRSGSAAGSGQTHGHLGEDLAREARPEGSGRKGVGKAIGRLGGNREVAGTDSSPKRQEDRMTIVDTSIWVDHFNRGNEQLANLLSEGTVLIHPFIIGELALGRMRNRIEILDLLNAIPQSTLAHHDEVLEFIERNRLVGVGIGWIDAHLLASMRLSNATILTTDKAMLSALARIRGEN